MALIPAREEYRVAGTVIAAVGGPMWDPASDVGLLRLTLRPTMYSLLLPNVPAGSYDYKISVNGSWATSYGLDGRCDPGCPNLHLTLSSPADVVFFFDVLTHRIDVDTLPVANTPAATTPGSRLFSVRSGERLERSRSSLRVLANSPARMPAPGPSLAARAVACDAAAKAVERSLRVGDELGLAREAADQLWQSAKLFAVVSLADSANEGAATRALSTIVEDLDASMTSAGDASARVSYSPPDSPSQLRDARTNTPPLTPILTPVRTRRALVSKPVVGPRATSSPRAPQPWEGSPASSSALPAAPSESGSVTSEPTEENADSENVAPLELVVPRSSSSGQGGICASFTHLVKMILRPLCGETDTDVPHVYSPVQMI